MFLLYIYPKFDENNEALLQFIVILSPADNIQIDQSLIVPMSEDQLFTGLKEYI